MLALAVAALLAALVLYVRGPYPHGDQSLYVQYARAFWTGPDRFHSLPAEYPPLSLLPFTLAILPPLPDFATVFALWMLGLLVAALLLVARLESPRAAEVCAVYLAVGAWGTVLGRYDLVPAVVTLGALWAARARRFPAAYALLGAGVLLKLYPAVLLPAVAIEQWRGPSGGPLRWPPPRAVLAGAGVFGAVVGAGFAAAYLLDPAGWLGSLGHNVRRPLQVESVPATLLWASGVLGLPVHTDKSFGSDNLVGALDGALGLAALTALLAGLLWTYRSQAAGRLGIAGAFAACLVVVLCTGRVLSPQYLIWALPLIAIASGDYDPLWLLVCALTVLEFPFAFSQLHPVGSGPPPAYPTLLLVLVALRNAVLVVAAVRLLRPQQRSMAMLGPGRWRSSKPQIGR